MWSSRTKSFINLKFIDYGVLSVIKNTSSKFVAQSKNLCLLSCKCLCVSNVLCYFKCLCLLHSYSQHVV